MTADDTNLRPDGFRVHPPAPGVVAPGGVAAQSPAATPATPATPTADRGTPAAGRACASRHVRARCGSRAGGRDSLAAVAGSRCG